MADAVASAGLEEGHVGGLVHVGVGAVGLGQDDVVGGCVLAVVVLEVGGWSEGGKYWLNNSLFCFSSKILSFSLIIRTFRSDSLNLLSCSTILVRARFNSIFRALISAFSAVIGAEFCLCFLFSVGF